MTAMRESDLPGVGKKFRLDTRGGDQLVIVVHDDGRRELYLFADGERDDYVAVVTLDDDEARQAAAVIGGVIYQPTALESTEVALDRLAIQWCRIAADAGAADQSIGQLQVRRRTGATVIAVVGADGSPAIAPGPEQVIPAGGTVVVAGTRESIRACQRLLQHGRL